MMARVADAIAFNRVNRREFVASLLDPTCQHVPRRCRVVCRAIMGDAAAALGKQRRSVRALVQVVVEDSGFQLQVVS